ncbi:MAG: dehydrogenase E1 component subunit alpha/beta [Candidatus Pacebacteria bacterium]|nr:dehydrogenase E1 component subunit alpha/beta [Candidatus Paceibacterota bacterium]
MSKETTKDMNYYSDITPDFAPREVTFDPIPVFQYKKTLAKELKSRTISKAESMRLYECMLTIREFEDMILKLRTGAYEAIADYNYRGPTHLSIGQEATSAGVCSVLSLADYITSTHRGHGDSIAKGVFAIFEMTEDQLRERRPDCADLKGRKLQDAVMEDHVFRTIAELFGKEDGYGKGRGGGMHIADFRVGHLGANAIVGGGVPIATGAAMTCRLEPEHERITACFAGDGAYANGVVLESLNWAAQSQYTGDMAQTKFGLPVVYCIINNHYGMTGRCQDEVTGVDFLARRGAGFGLNNMHAEVVNGMDPLAVRDALARARKIMLDGKGPVLLEFDTYRYYGHSLSDPRNEYRTRDEETRYREIDPLKTFRKALIDADVATDKQLQNLEEKVAQRNERAAQRAAESADPAPEDVIKYMYTDTVCSDVPAKFQKVETYSEPPTIKRDKDNRITVRDSIKEALIEEMLRDNRVVFYGEDVADYGGAFKATKGLLEMFGRNRVFNAPISEACICGTAVGMAMSGYRPVAELMYMDFSLMASDQIANQAAKWHYMVGGATEVPLVYRVSVGGGKGYGGQHSQSLESVFCHIPGLRVVYPSNAYDTKGMLKTAIRDNNPVMFVESQLLYNEKGTVPDDDYLVPFGEANVLRQGDDVTILAWGPAVPDAVTAGETLAKENISAEVIDLRSLVPLDETTIFESVRKTGRCVVVSQCVDIGSFTGDIVARVTRECFDYLDSPPVKVGAANGIAPQAYSLEQAFLPNAGDVMAAAKSLM